MSPAEIASCAIAISGRDSDGRDSELCKPAVSPVHDQENHEKKHIRMCSSLPHGY